MTDPTGAAMPFTEKRGRLRLAPLGTTEPRNFASSADSAHEQRFLDSWPPGWILVGETDPAHCRVEGQSAAEEIRGRRFDPFRLAVTERSLRWSFGLDAIAMAPLTKLRQQRDDSPLEPARMMLGWESLDRTARALVPQMFVCEGLDSAFGFTVAIEQPPVPPLFKVYYTAR